MIKTVVDLSSGSVDYNVQVSAEEEADAIARTAAGRELRLWTRAMEDIDAEGMDRFREEQLDSMIAGGLTINSYWLEIHGRKKAKRAQKP